MIKRLVIQGYRSLKHLDWRPGALNVIIGENCSGKSNLLKAIDLLSKAAAGRFQNSIEENRGYLGIHSHFESTAYPLEWLINAGETINKEEDTWYELDLGGILGEFSVFQESIFNQKIDDASQSPMFKGINYFGFLNKKLSYMELNGQRREIDFNEDRKETFLSEIASPVNHPIYRLLKSRLSEVFVYGQFNTLPGSPIRKSSVSQYQPFLERSGNNLANVLHTLCTIDGIVKPELYNSLRAAFGENFSSIEFPPAGTGNIELSIKWKFSTLPHSASVLSDGTLKFLCLLAIFLNPHPPRLICIDEPETGLHPSMFPLVAEAAQQAAMRTQVILTTHSPEFLNHFSEEEGVVSVMYLKDGASRIKRLQGEPLKTWLESYKLGRLMISGGLDELARDEDE